METTELDNFPACLLCASRNESAMISNSTADKLTFVSKIIFKT
jgi:hypothetical protein